MLDIKFMRENRDAVLEAMRALAAEDAPVAQALALDERRRAILVRVEVLRAERNSGSKQIGQLMREGKRAEGQALQAHMSADRRRDQDAGRGAGAGGSEPAGRHAAHPESAAPQRAGRGETTPRT